MRNWGLITGGGAIVAAAAALLYLNQSGQIPDDTAAPPSGAAIVAITLPNQLTGEARLGKRVFDENCVTCHGVNATGYEGAGPPLVHKIYEPGHHADFSFQRAVRQGVRSHHWRFGDMPPVDGLSDADIAQVTRYVRELQRENGIN